MSDVVRSIRTIAKEIEDLDLKCRWCKTPIKAQDVDYYVHGGGIPIKETFPNKAWVYFHCTGCDYEWALWKLINQAKAQGRNP